MVDIGDLDDLFDYYFLWDNLFILGIGLGGSEDEGNSGILVEGNVNFCIGFCL